MGWNKVKQVAAARIIVTGGVASIDTNITNNAVASVSRLSTGRIQVNVESNSTWPSSGGSPTLGNGVEVQVTPESDSPVYATVEARVSDSYVIVRTFRGNAPYGAAIDCTFNLEISQPRAAFE